MRFPVKRFLSYYKPYRTTFVSLLACALVTSALALVFPLLVRYITNDVLAGHLSTALPDVYRVGALMVALMVAQTVGSFVVDYKGHELGARMENDMRRELFAHLQALPLGFFDTQQVGQLMSRITNDLLLVSELYHHGPEDYVDFIARFVGAFIILYGINAPLTVAVFAFVPVLGAFVLYCNKGLNAALIGNKRRIADVNAQVADSLAGVRVVKSFANEAIEVDKFSRANARFLESRKQTYRVEAYVSNGAGAFIQLITIAVVVLGSASIVHGTLGLADLITYVLYMGYVTAPVRRLGFMSTQLQAGVTGFQRFIEIRDLEPEVLDPPGAQELQSVRGEIQFQDVNFGYQDRSAYVLKQLAFGVRAGEYVALVGTSGVGKTTLCSLIPRFYDVDAGAVLIDGQDVRDVHLGSLRRNVGVVHQDVYLFAGTVMDNIRYGKPPATTEEVVAAAKLANAHDFVMELPKGYDSEIGERGVRLSGGQRQRLSIARAFLKNPPILILDEATSSLDNESESLVQEALELLAKGRTTIVIAHRLSTIRHAERILVLSDGRVAEQGTHAELMARQGIYARLYARQFDL